MWVVQNIMFCIVMQNTRQVINNINNVYACQMFCTCFQIDIRNFEHTGPEYFAFAMNRWNTILNVAAFTNRLPPLYHCYGTY